MARKVVEKHEAVKAPVEPEVLSETEDNGAEHEVVQTPEAKPKEESVNFINNYRRGVPIPLDSKDPEVPESVIFDVSTGKYVAKGEKTIAALDALQGKYHIVRQ